MNYSDTFRRSTASRRYSQRIEVDSYQSRPSNRYPAAYIGASASPDPREVLSRPRETEDGDLSHRPGPSSAPPRREHLSPDETEKHETVVIQNSSSSVPRLPDRRARVEDEPTILHTAPGSGPHPSRVNRPRSDIEPRATKRYGEENGSGQRRHSSIQEHSPIFLYSENPGISDGISQSYARPGDAILQPPGRHRRSYDMPPPPAPGADRPEARIYINRRRTHDLPPPPPPPYGLHTMGKERPDRRSSSRARLPPPQPPTVPPGFVTPSPYLVSSYQRPAGSAPGHGNVGGGHGGGGGGGGRHDLATLAEQPDPKANQKVRNSIVLCVYRHSQKAFDYRFVPLRSSTDHRLDRASQHFTTDLHVFQEMRRTYEKELRGRIRRFFSFKVPSTVRLLQYGDGMFFRPDQEDDIFSSKFMRIWHNPKEELDGAMDRYEWNRWLLQQKALADELDMAVELIEDYVPDRIVLFLGMWLIVIAVLTAAWLIEGGEPGLVSTVMGFVLTFIAALVALTSVWDWFDGNRSKEIQERAVVVIPNAIERQQGQKLGQKGPPPP
ncbi:unnamed protein product [Diplocarpon coronariae]